MISVRKMWLVAVCAMAGFGCSETSSTQVLTGRLATSGALAVRAVSGNRTVTAAQVRSDGSFTLALPAGENYRLEVLTTSGVRHVLASRPTGLADLAFSVCDPTAPWDVGAIANGDPSGPPGMCSDPTDPTCNPPPCPAGDPTCGSMCSDPSDPDCHPPCMDPTAPGCMPPPTCTDPTDPGCMPPPTCTDPTDPGCMPPPCMAGDPTCGTVCTDPTDPHCLPPPPPCMDPTDPYCNCDAAGGCPPPTCASTDPMCPPPPPGPCTDPTDPDTCQDPCMADPASCGCPSTDPTCWPDPQPPTCDPMGMCDPSTGGMTPAHPPGDFGCKENPAS